MKLPAIIIFCCLLIFLCLGYIFTNHMEQSDKDRTQLREIQELKNQILQERDSFKKEIGAARDSLGIALNTILLNHQESIEARERSMKTIRNLQSILYISYQSDSARTNALRKLYPTFKPN